MKQLRLIFIYMVVVALVSPALANSMYDRKTTANKYLFDVLISQGIPREAVDLVFRVFDYNEGRIPNTDSAVIVDYSLPSTVKRFYLMNFNTGMVERFYVSHGINSGIIQARSLSNLPNSLKSSIGFYYAKGTYQSQKNGLSLFLDGIDRSNNNARFRNIVLHGAKYVGDDFISQNRRLGWSEGCFAVGLDVTQYLINTLQSGSIIFSYHKDLLVSSHQNPDEQNLGGREILPPGVNTNRTPGEGGGGQTPAALLNSEYPRLISPLDF